MIRDVASNIEVYAHTHIQLTYEINYTNAYLNAEPLFTHTHNQIE